MTDLCIFCMRPDGCPPYCTDNPGKGCTYGLGHEFPDGEETKPKQQPKKIDKNVCTKCGLHARNPASVTNGCAHDYPV